MTRTGRTPMYQPYPAGTQLPEVQRPSTAYFKGIIAA
jgi:hypothetical protein